MLIIATSLLFRHRTSIGKLTVDAKFNLFHVLEIKIIYSIFLRLSTMSCRLLAGLLQKLWVNLYEFLRGGNFG